LKKNVKTLINQRVCKGMANTKTLHLRNYDLVS